MTSFRNGTHAALIAVLISQRKALKLTLRTVAARMPKYLGWDHTTLVKIEQGRRNVSFVERANWPAFSGRTSPVLSLPSKR